VMEFGPSAKPFQSKRGKKRSGTPRCKAFLPRRSGTKIASKTTRGMKAQSAPVRENLALQRPCHLLLSFLNSRRRRGIEGLLNGSSSRESTRPQSRAGTGAMETGRRLESTPPALPGAKGTVEAHAAVLSCPGWCCCALATAALCRSARRRAVVLCLAWWSSSEAHAAAVLLCSGWRGTL
jgi:hypothetical protein